jgi:hypothetical protein
MLMNGTTERRTAMRRMMLGLMCTAWLGCDSENEARLRLADDLVPPPQSSLTLQTVANVTAGDPISFDVTGADPGARIDLVIGNGGESTDGGPCPSVLGGNCLDILPGTLGLRIFTNASADSSGNATIDLNVPPQARAGIYQFQAVVRAGQDSNESGVATVEIFSSAVCEPDALEPNDMVAMASAVTGTTVESSLCPDDLIDYFSIVVPDLGVLLVETVTSVSTGDLELEMLSSTGLVLDGSYGLGDTEDLAWYNLTGSDQLVYLRTYSSLVMGDEGITYTLTPELLVPEPCIDDAQEDDDVLTEAQEVSDGIHSGQSCLGDSDWFAVDVMPDELVSLEVLADADSGDVDLRVYDAIGVEITGGATDSYSYTSSSASTLYVEVVLSSDDEFGGGNAYDLSIERVQVQVCPEDVYEPNDSDAAAASVTPGTYSGLGACFDAADDWYAVGVSAGDELTVELSFLTDDADVDMRVYDPFFNEVARSESGSDDEAIVHDALFDGDYLIHVFLWENTADGDPAVGGGLYDMTISVN